MTYGDRCSLTEAFVSGAVHQVQRGAVMGDNRHDPYAAYGCGCVILSAGVSVTLVAWAFAGFPAFWR